MTAKPRPARGPETSPGTEAASALAEAYQLLRAIAHRQNGSAPVDQTGAAAGEEVRDDARVSQSSA